MPTRWPARFTSGVDWTARNPGASAISRCGANPGSVVTSVMTTLGMLLGGPAARGPVIGHGAEILHKLWAEPALGHDLELSRGRVGELHDTSGPACHPHRGTAMVAV